MRRLKHCINMKAKSDTQRLRAWILSGKSITPLQALEKFRCLRLGARILDLRNEGYDIVTQIVHKNGKRFARYKLAS